MKTERPEYYLPKPAVVSCDVRKAFVRVQQKLAEKLQAYTGELNFATDMWTAPNHKSFTAITVHLEDEGEALSLPLKIVEVVRVTYVPQYFGPI